VAKGVSIWVQSIFHEAICWYLYFLLFLAWNFTFTFYSESCIGNSKWGFNLGPVNLPRCHLLVSVLSLLLLPLQQAGLCTYFFLMEFSLSLFTGKMRFQSESSQSSRMPSAGICTSFFLSCNFTFYLQSCIGNRKGGFNMSPVNLPTCHLLVSVLFHGISLSLST